MNDLISVIVPVYNCERFIEQCVKSILYQSYQNIEVILIDDGAIDNSGEICDKLHEVDHRVVVIHNTNHGVSYSRNCGIKMAKGKYIAFIDSDDWIEQNTLEELYSTILSAGVDACFSSLYYKDLDKICRSTYLNKGVYSQEEIIKLHSKGSFISSSCMALYSTDIVKKCCFEEEVLVLEDWLLNMVFLCSCNKISLIDSPMYHYRTNGDSVSQTKLDARKLTSFKITGKLMRCVDNQNIDYLCVSSFIINSMAVFLAKSDIKQCKNEAKALRDEARSIVKNILKKQEISTTQKMSVILCAINPRLFCMMFQIKNRGK